MMKVIELFVLSFIGGTGLTMTAYALNPKSRGRFDPEIRYNLRKQTIVAGIVSYIVFFIFMFYVLMV